MFVYSPANEDLGCFQVTAVTSTAAMNIHIQVYVWTYIFISLRIDGSDRKYMFTFIRKCQSVAQSCFPDFYKDGTKSEKRSRCFYQNPIQSKGFDDQEDSAEICPKPPKQ